MNKDEIIIINGEVFYRIPNGTSYYHAPLPKQFKPYFERLEQENKILRENAEHNDKVVDSIRWENRLLHNKIDKAIELYENCKEEDRCILDLEMYEILKGDVDE